MVGDDRSGAPGPRELLLHRLGTVAVNALADGATEDDLREVLDHAVAAWRRRQLAVVPAAVRHLRAVPTAG
jgi:hypothetical protein